MPTPDVLNNPDVTVGAVQADPVIPMVAPPPSAPPFLTADAQRRSNREHLAALGINLDGGKPKFIGPGSEDEAPEAPEEREQALGEQEGEEGAEEQEESPESLLIKEPPAEPTPDLRKEALKENAEGSKDFRKAMKRLEAAESRIQKREQELDSKLDVLKQRESAFAKIMEKVITTAPSAMVAQDPVVKDFHDTYPEFGAVLEKYHAATVSMVEGLRKEFLSLAGEMRTVVAEEAADRVLGKVFTKYPDAKEVVASEEFQSWLASLPPTIASTYTNIIQETSKYTAEDAIAVLDTFAAWRASQGMIPASQPAPAKPNAPRRPAAPPPAPGDGMPAARRGAAPPMGSDALRPLSQQELSEYSLLFSRATTLEQRALLRKRMELTMQVGPTP